MTNDNLDAILRIYIFSSKDYGIFLRDLGGEINEKEIISVNSNRFPIGA